MRAHHSAGFLIAFVGLLSSLPAIAQPSQPDVAAPGAAPSTSTPVVTGTPTPPPPTPPPPTPPAAVAADKTPPAATETMPASRPEALPPISVGAWTRVGATIQGATDSTKLNDVRMDTAYVELHAGGKIHKKVGVTLNLNGNISSFAPPGGGMGEGGSYVGIMDAIIQGDFMDEFHIWAGHLLVPVDRANASGPFFMIPWNYPGFIGAAVGAPKEGPFGRNNGVVVWGDINGGQLTYLAGAFDSADVTTSPLFSGRLRLALFDKEGGFWGNGSYFGEKDLLTIGVGGQFQSNGSSSMTEEKDFATVNADVLFEKKLGGGSFFTAEGAYYHYKVADGSVSDHFYVLGAYATPELGIGSIQPMVRYQWMKVQGPGDVKPWNLDAGVSLLIKGPALRLLATYSHNDFGDTTSEAIQLGAQAIFF